MKLPLPFVQLPITFDAAALADEVAALGEQGWRNSPGGDGGRAFLALVSVGGDPGSSDTMGPMRPTPWLERCPCLMRALEALGGIWGRTRLMRLPARSGIAAHVDSSYYWRERACVHIPIVTAPSVRFMAGNTQAHMAAGECWVVDTWRRHQMLNDGNGEWIHLVADTVGGATLWELVAAGRAPATAPSDWRVSQVRPKTGDSVPELRFETVNTPVVMRPWEIRAHVAFVLAEALQHPRLSGVQQVLGRFAREWQGMWAWHGEHSEGWPYYRSLLDATWRELIGCGAEHVGLSNGVGLVDALAPVFDAAVGDRAGGAGRVRRRPAEPCNPPALSLTGTTHDPTFDRPIFIISPPRSGSTLLFETLASAPGVYTIGDESHALIEAGAGLNLNPAGRGYDSNRLIEADASDEVALRLRERFREALRDRNGHRGDGLAAVRMLEKTPKNALRILFLHKVFPEARFVYLYREPRQVLASMIEGWRSGRFRTYPDLPGWAGPAWSFLLTPGWRGLIGETLEEVVGQQWECTTRILLDDLDTVSADRWVAIDYERLLAEPQEQVLRLCEWAQLDWDRTLGAELPFSRYTLTRPDTDKWRTHAHAIETQLAKRRAIADRAVRTAASRALC
jgi:hypothetical protein